MVLDLFSGIGGFSLGLERAGMETVAFCESDAKARLILKKHWPEIPIYEDVRMLTNEQLKKDGIVADSNGFAGKIRGDDKTNAGESERWTNNKRGSRTNDCRKSGTKENEQNGVIEEPARSIDLICGGFPCQPFSQAGKQEGFSDDRDLWPEYFRIIQEVRPAWVIGENVAGFINMGLKRTVTDLEGAGYAVQSFVIPACAVGAVHRRDRIWIVAYAGDKGWPFWDLYSGREGEKRTTGDAIKRGLARVKSFEWWAVEPDVGRVAHGVPQRVDRLKQLGNAVVPQVVEVIGRAIMESNK